MPKAAARKSQTNLRSTSTGSKTLAPIAPTKRSSKKAASKKPKPKTRQDLLADLLRQMLRDLLADEMVALHEPIILDDADHWLVKEKGEDRHARPMFIGRQMSKEQLDLFVDQFVDHNVVLGEIEDLFETTSMET